MTWFRNLLTLALLLLCVAPSAQAGKKKAAEMKVVDSGSFGVLVGGRRVATESFEIRQGSDASIATAELKILDGSEAEQSAEMLVTSAGDLRRYTWRELKPGKAQIIVEPQDQFLVQHTFASPIAKPNDQPYLVPASTSVLDDYFFSHRQILLWRYLAAGCKGVVPCNLKKAQMGVLVPRQHTSMLVTIEYQGRDKILVKGAPQELDRFLLQADGADWQLWVDSNYHLIRVLIAQDNTEVVRD